MKNIETEDQVNAIMILSNYAANHLPMSPANVSHLPLLLFMLPVPPPFSHNHQGSQSAPQIPSQSWR